MFSNRNAHLEGTLSPNPWDLSLSRQNGCCGLELLERRTGLSSDATRAPIQGPDWQRVVSTAAPENSDQMRLVGLDEATYSK